MEIPTEAIIEVIRGKNALILDSIKGVKGTRGQKAYKYTLWAERLAKKLENSNLKAIALNNLLSTATLEEIERQIDSTEAST
ncbi:MULTISPECIES: hypothetical protein [Nostoc]|uniref:Transposase n=1 Tax=Nostoc punctiforme FACHB-252 TaxID=1357509 RepID=A0ABR8HMN9_NOSPU|nr:MULTISPECIES: hypothetical protein [Nostoc]MBC1238808.1 hypothetical protein [Nostoc sp. 2RC]MBD2616506.1 hypothetical protein [Nostoc punctiforme FACHB-252]